MSIFSHPPFFGLLPRYGVHVTDQQYATEALDVDLRQGDLRPWREPLLLNEGVYKNGYFCGCEVVPIDVCETVTKLKGDCGYKILSGKEKARLVCNNVDKPMTLPYSDTPPQVLVTDPPSSNDDEDIKRRDAERVYAYSYVDEYQRESLLSAHSTKVAVRDGGEVFISGFVNPDTEFNIQHINVYRNATGYRSGGEEAVEDATMFFLVGSVPDANTAFVDRVQDLHLGKACSCMFYYPPDDRLRGIKLYEPTNQLVGFFGTQVHFSQANKSHVWPVEYKYDFAEEGDVILNIIPGDDGVYVLMKHKMILITNITCEPKAQYETIILDIPRYVGTNDSTVLNTRIGVIINSIEGVLLLNGRQYTNLTSGWFSPSDWKDNNISSVRLGYFESFLTMVTHTGTYMLHIDNNTGSVSGRELTMISDTPNNFISSPTGELVLLTDDGAFQWDAGLNYRQFLWSTKYFKHSVSSIGYALVDAEGLVQIGVNSNFFQTGGDNEISRVRAGKKSRKHILSISAKIPVQAITLGSSRREIAHVRS